MSVEICVRLALGDLKIFNLSLASTWTKHKEASFCSQQTLPPEPDLYLILYYGTSIYIGTANTMASFVPRTSFPSQFSVPRSYFLGHHAAGLSKMKTMLSSIDLIIECRDYRVPLTSRNPLFEQSLAGRERLTLYTKRDLGSGGGPADRKVSFPKGKI